MARLPRRRYLQLCGTIGTVALAGCREATDSTETSPATDSEATSNTATSTDTETPTDTRTETETPTDTETEQTADTETEQTTDTEESTPESVAEVAWTVDTLTGQIDTLLLPECGPTDDLVGPLYAMSETGQVASIDPTDGSHAWTVRTSGEKAESPTVTPTDETVYAVSETFTDERLANHVEAIDPATGDVHWSITNQYFLRVAGIADDLVVLAGEYIDDHPEKIGPNTSPRGDGRLFGVGRESGEVRWTVDVPELESADVAAHGVYALEYQGGETYANTLIAFDLDGTERWRVDTGTTSPEALLAADDLLLAGASVGDAVSRGSVARYDLADGSRLWTAGEWRYGPDDVAVSDGTIYAGARPLLALDRDGNERFRVQGFGVPDVPPTPETLYNDGGHQIPAFDREAGVIRWRYRPDEFQYTHLRAVLADHVAVDRGIGEDQGVVLLGEHSGEVVGTFVTPDAYWGAVGNGRRLFLGVGSDVVAYDLAADLD